MNWETRFLICLFAIMFFWVLSVEAFAQTQRCWRSSAGVLECIGSDGKITTTIILG